MIMMFLLSTILQEEYALNVCVMGFKRQAVHVALGEAS